MVNRSEPKIILFDIETMPDMNAVMSEMPGLSAYPGLTLKASINSVICFGYKVLGDAKPKCLNAWDYKSWDKDINDDRELLIALRAILITADAVVTHNGKRFDWKFIQTRFLKHGIEPLPKILHIDTCSEAKRALLIFNNRLNTIAKYMTDTKKLENGGWELWSKVMARDKAAMQLMTKYCKQDVEVLHEVFKKLRPFINSLPNYNMFRSHEEVCCSNCGSTRLIGNGEKVTKTAIMKRLLCKDCGTSLQVRKDGQDPKAI